MLDFIFRWETLWYLLLVIYIPVCLGLIAVVLLQKGKGTGFAGAFGIGPGSEAVFGPRGSRSLPVKLTRVGAGLFLTLALVMSLVAGRVGTGRAPDLVDVDEGAIPQDVLDPLEELGLGTGTPGLAPLELDSAPEAAAPLELEVEAPEAAPLELELQAPQTAPFELEPDATGEDAPGIESPGEDTEPGAAAQDTSVDGAQQ